jgi:hypothetical protein
MIVPSGSRFSDWKYVEVASFQTWYDKEDGKKIEAVVRDKVKNEDTPIFLEWGEQVVDYRKKHNNIGVYTSVFRYPDKDVSLPCLGSLYFDLDAEGDIDKSHHEAKNLYVHLCRELPSEIIRIYFTGSKGFHIEVEAYALGISPSTELPVVFRYIASKLQEELNLTTLDFGVYDSRRMWRLPDSRHQKSGLFKVELLEGDLFSSSSTIIDIASGPRGLFDPPIDFDVRANEWYKNWVSRYEGDKKQASVEALERRQRLFEKYGSSILKKHNKKYVDLALKSAIESLRETEPDKNRNITLSRQSFKLYCVMMEADIDPEEVTDTLHDIGLEIGLGSAEVRRTLGSALRAARKKFENNRSEYV